MRRFGLLLILAAMVSGSPAQGDTYTITLAPGVREEAATGRVILFFITEAGFPWNQRLPIEGPFYEVPQPLASVAVEDFGPGESITISGTTQAFLGDRLGRLEELEGRVRVQVILDADTTVRSHRGGPGNVYSDVKTVTLSRDRDDHVTLDLSNPNRGIREPRGPRNLRWVHLPSELLSDHSGREIEHLAGIALPRGYDLPQNANRRWPVVYLIPGFGGRYVNAVNYAAMLQNADPEFAPQAVFIVLDPDSPLGHHGFVDSPNHGPRGTALVAELIPHLESTFRLAARPEGRVLYGHSSGGWTSLWLQLQWPDVFGACWSSAPDPIDFSAFQMNDLYRDRNLYRLDPNVAGNETPSYRKVDINHRSIVLMTVRQECLMEYAMHPGGHSGEQWDAWEAMFSPRDAATGLPRPMFDPLTGAIDREVVEHWSRFDIRKMVRDEWDRYGPIVRNKVRLACGDLDSFYLNRAVKKFDELVRLRTENVDTSGDEGYVWFLEFGTHGNLPSLTTQRFHTEMIEYFRKHGLHD